MPDSAANINKTVDFKEISPPIDTCKKFLILRMNTKEKNEKNMNSKAFIKTNLFGFFEDLMREKA
ncbi:MAG: hypothetical protein LBQ04_00295 [Endomicrobium sp.]|nr:hypothetical protein [Endomicrobium sp.]